MRALLLIGLVGAAACSHGDTGLAITLSAPDGPQGVDRIEVVMASPDVVTVEGQPTLAPVRYYRQKSSAGVIENVSALDGYSLRLEGRPGKGDEKFIPLVIAYAGSAPVAVGAVPDSNGKPLALVVPDSSRVEATVAMVPLKAVDPANGILIGQLAEMRCGANAAVWRSGIVWHPLRDTQLRLVFPDPADPSQLDASSRRLDLDCDDSPADDGDCDDLRARIGATATEACDGADVNCDGAHFAFTRCNPPEIECGAGSTDGIALCRDMIGGVPGVTCMGSPACRCQSSTGSNLCSKCTLSFKGSSSDATPCSPAVAQIPMEGCTATAPCTVEVVRYGADDSEWEIEIAPGERAEFKQSATILNGQAWLRVRSRRETVPATPGTSIGAVHLVVASGLNLRAVGIDLQLKDMVDDCSSAAGQIPETYQMACSLQ